MEFKKNYTFTVGGASEDELRIRNNRDALIADIVNATNELNKKRLAKMLAIAANTMKWSAADLHALLKKKQDPTVRNYTAFVKWSCKMKR